MTMLIYKVVALAAIQGASLAATVVAVVHASLSPFAQALIIAIVGATISAIGAIAAALIAREETRKAEELAKQNEQHLLDLKAATGVDRRGGDRIGEP